MKLLNTKQLVHKGQVLCLNIDVAIDKNTNTNGEDDNIYNTQKKISKTTLGKAKATFVKKYNKKHIIAQIRDGKSLEGVESVDFSELKDLRGLFAHYSYDINISQWVIAEDSDCSYMFAFSEFGTWDHLPKTLREKLINPTGKIDTTGIFCGCKGEEDFINIIAEERKNRKIQS